MKFYICAAFVLSFLSQCGSRVASKEKVDKKVSIRTHFEIAGMDGTVQNLDDTINIIYHENYVLCELPFEFILEDGERVLKKETRFKYFVFRKGESEGQIFDSLTSASGKIISTYSIMNNRLLGKLNFYDLLKDYHQISADSSQRGNLKEVYIPNREEENKYCDTILTSYSKTFSKIDFSFSRELDSIKGRKLFMIEMLFAEKFYKTYNKVIRRRNYKFELVEVPVYNYSALQNFFLRVKAIK